MTSAKPRVSIEATKSMACGISIDVINFERLGALSKALILPQLGYKGVLKMLRIVWG